MSGLGQTDLFAPAELAGLGRLHWRGFNTGVHRVFWLYRGDEQLDCYVRHCGHPTALRPWYHSQGAGCWAHVSDAQDAALASWRNT